MRRSPGDGVGLPAGHGPDPPALVLIHRARPDARLVAEVQQRFAVPERPCRAPRQRAARRRVLGDGEGAAAGRVTAVWRLAKGKRTVLAKGTN